MVQYLKLHISINVQNWPQQISIMMISWGLLSLKKNAIEEEEERLEVSFEDNEEEEEDEEEIEDLRLHINDGSDEALPPPSFYQSASANSSNSSLKTKTIEKTLSNSSSSSLFATPRSGAKASRYKNIYDQSKLYQTQ